MASPRDRGSLRKVSTLRRTNNTLQDNDLDPGETLLNILAGTNSREHTINDNKNTYQ